MQASLMIGLFARLMAGLTLAAFLMSAATAEVLKTPASRFVGLPDYLYEGHVVSVPWGTTSLAMAYVDEGPRNGSVALLVHGQPSWSFMYRKVIAGLVAKGHRVIAPDLIGYGRSDKPAAMTDYSYDRHLKAIESLVRQLDLRDVTLVVHDWGGLLGLPTAAAMPDRFARLALLNTSLNDGTDPETPQFKAGFDRWIEILRTAPIVEVDKVIAAQTAKRPPDDVLAAYMAPFPDGSYQSGVRRMSALIPRDPSYPRAKENGEVRRILAGWKKPVLIAFSEDSDRVHPGQFALFNRLFPKPSIWASRKISGSKHFLLEDQPQVITDLIYSFASGAPAPAAEQPIVLPLTPSLEGSRLHADVGTYVGFGEQRTGTAASAKTLAWLDQRLKSSGYATRRLSLPVQVHSPTRAALQVGARRVEDGFPVWPVVWTAPAGITAPLRPLSEAGPADIALVRLPFSPYASVFDPAYRPIFAEVARRQPRAVVAITEHPTGEVVALNVRGAEEQGRASPRPFPVLAVGSRHSEALEAAAARDAAVTLTLTGTTQPGSDDTLIAERGDTSKPALVISTPRNGWFKSGGERGPGIAIALGLADWLARARPDLPVRLVFTSHHELGGDGMREVLARDEFRAERVKLWLHLGANAATTEPTMSGGKLQRSAGPNAQRGVAASEGFVDDLRKALASATVSVELLDPRTAVGETALIARRGGAPTVGIVGYQLLHHTRLDDATSTSPEILEPLARGLAAFLEGLQ